MECLSFSSFVRLLGVSLGADDAGNVIPGRVENEGWGRWNRRSETDRQSGFIDQCLLSLTQINLNGRKATEADASPDQPLPSLSSSSSSPPPSVSPFCPLAVLTAADLEGQISHIRYLLLRVPVFFMIIILPLWQTVSAVKGPFIEFLFPEKKNTLISLRATVLLILLPRGISAQLFAEGCQWVSLMVCRCQMVEFEISLSFYAAHNFSEQPGSSLLLHCASLSDIKETLKCLFSLLFFIFLLYF